MGNLYNKTNAPYLIAGTLATLTLLTSGVFAIAPYVAFLSPIAALGIALPVALSLSILSVLVLALSCKMISNNKKVEVEKNKLAQKKQELANVKQQLESKVQELENKITLEKEAANKEVEKLKNQSHELTREKQNLESKIEGLNKEIDQLKKQLTDVQQKLDGAIKESSDKSQELKSRVGALNNENKDLRDTNVKLNMQVGQLECEKNNSLRYTEELRDENTGLSEKVNSLKEELYQHKLESEKNKLCLKSEYEDKLRLELKRKDKLSSELECKSREASSLKVQLAMLRENVKRLEEEGKSKNCTSSFDRDESILAKRRNLIKKLNQEKDRNKELEKELEDTETSYNNEASRNLDLVEQNKKHLSEISKLNEELSYLKDELMEEKKQSEAKIGNKVRYLTGIELQLDACRDERGTVQNNVLEVVRKTFEDELLAQTKGCAQDEVQEAVHLFMNKVIRNLCTTSSEHSSECEGISENKSANEQFPEPPYTPTPTGLPCKKLDEASRVEDLGYVSGYSTPR